jgi:hypothetical protein
MGFADGVLEDEKRTKQAEAYAFSKLVVTNSLLDKMKAKSRPLEPPREQPEKQNEMETKTTIKSLTERLVLISGGIRNV